MMIIYLNRLFYLISTIKALINRLNCYQTQNYTKLKKELFQLEKLSNLIDEYSLTLNYKKKPSASCICTSVKSFTDLLGLDMTDVDKQATYISPLDSQMIVEDFEKMRFTAKKYHNVSFRSPVNDLIKVNIVGSIDYPGTYTLKSDSTLDDLYQLVGNFKDEAFLGGIILTRTSVRDRQLKAIETSEAALNKSILYSAQQGEDIAILL